jgi:hypothetical protein
VAAGFSKTEQIVIKTEITEKNPKTIAVHIKAAAL